MYKKAFTLAEVLITLGIIGVVAAMTMPTLIHDYKKHVVETRLKSFYSNINQAILLAENEYGDKKSWTWTNTDDFFDTYLKKYLKFLEIEDYTFAGLTHKKIYFANGSMILFVCYDSNLVLFDLYPKSTDTKEYVPRYGKNRFSFAFAPNGTGDYIYHNNRGVEPYKIWWNGDEATLSTNGLYGCNSNSPEAQYCTEIIYRNGWKIPKDYPFRF